MTTDQMSIAQLWAAHFRNPNNAVIRNAIGLRDPNGARQLWPISRPCNVSEHARIVSDLEDELAEETERADDNETSMSEKEELEDKVQDLEEEVEKLKEQLEEAVQQ